MTANVRALTCPPKSFRQFVSIFDLIERRERAPRVFAPGRATVHIPVATAAILWREGNDTGEIAKLLRVQEASVWNAMGTIRERAAEMRKGVA